MAPGEGLLFLYLLTNRHTNFLGIYRLTIEQMIRETRLARDVITRALAMFMADRKVFYFAGFIVIPKWSVPGRGRDNG
jgi:hypothetical protein